MQTLLMKIGTGMFVLLLMSNAAVEARNMNEQQLDAAQRGVVAIAAFTANGDLDNLAAALNRGLDAGLTVNEIKEILVQLYAYAGFPRSLNGINTFMAVLEERRGRGVIDETGREASPVPADLDRDAFGAKVRAQLAGSQVIPPPSGFQLFAPAADQFLKEHLFADIFARDVLDFQTRELATISALAALSGTSGQLQFHLGAALNMGLSEAQLKDFVAVIESQVGRDEALAASEVLDKVLSGRRAADA